MKKIFKKSILLGAAIALLLVGGALAACDKKTDGHEHIYGSWQVVTEAGCEVNGLKKHVCTVCGAEDTEEIPAAGHDWGVSKVTKEATCTQEGERVKTCKVCGATQPEKTPPIEHDWVTKKVIVPATCEEPGKAEQVCSVCGTSNEDATLPALEHDWEVPEIVKPATCEEPGMERKVCKRDGCHKEETNVIPALEHRWMNTRVIEPATCEENGVQEQTCQRPNCPKKTQQVPISALDHSWQSYYTVDTPPTFESEGVKSYHCNRCEKTQGAVSVPKLEANTPIPYEFRTLRNNGQLLIAPSMTLIVTDAETGAEVARSTPTDLNGGVFTKELLPKTYIVTAENLPAGYTCGKSFTVTPFDPYCNVYLTASVREGRPTGRYAVGDVMYDFTAPAANSTAGELNLKSVLQTKKMVLLNFWFVGCVYCEEEFPALERAYTKYQSTVEVIAVNQNDAMSAIESYRLQMGLSFPLVQNSAVGLITPFGVTGYPTSVVIDGEGVVSEILVGPQTQAKFEQLFAKYTEASGRATETAAPAAIAAPAALPPEKRVNAR